MPIFFLQQKLQVFKNAADYSDFLFYTAIVTEEGLYVRYLEKGCVTLRFFFPSHSLAFTVTNQVSVLVFSKGTFKSCFSPLNQAERLQLQIFFFVIWLQTLAKVLFVEECKDKVQTEQQQPTQTMQRVQTQWQKNFRQFKKRVP